MKSETQELFKRVFGDNLETEVSQSKQVITCAGSCKGTGYVEREELYDYHKRDYRTEYNACPTCKGDGRLTETTTRIQVSTRYPVSNYMKFKETKAVPYSEDPIQKTRENVYQDSFRINYDD